MPVPETSALLGVGLYCPPASQRASALLIVTFLSYELLSWKCLTLQFAAVLKRHCRVLRVISVTETEGQRFELRP